MIGSSRLRLGLHCRSLRQVRLIRLDKLFSRLQRRHSMHSMLFVARQPEHLALSQVGGVHQGIIQRLLLEAPHLRM